MAAVAPAPGRPLHLLWARRPLPARRVLAADGARRPREAAGVCGARRDHLGVVEHHGGALPAAGGLDGARRVPAGGELDGKAHAAAVRGPAAFEAGGRARRREPPVDLVHAEPDDRIGRLRRRRRRRVQPTTTTTSPPERSTSAQRRAATSPRRNAPWKTRATMAPSTRPRRSAVSGRSRPRPAGRGRVQAASTAAHSSTVRPRAPRPEASGASRRKPASTCRVRGPVRSSWPASRRARRTAETVRATVEGARPVSRRCAR